VELVFVPRLRDDSATTGKAPERELVARYGKHTEISWPPHTKQSVDAPPRSGPPAIRGESRALSFGTGGCCCPLATRTRPGVDRAPAEGHASRQIDLGGTKFGDDLL